PPLQGSSIDSSDARRVRGNRSVCSEDNRPPPAPRSKPYCNTPYQNRGRLNPTERGRGRAASLQGSTSATLPVDRLPGKLNRLPDIAPIGPRMPRPRTLGPPRSVAVGPADPAAPAAGADVATAAAVHYFAAFRACSTASVTSSLPFCSASTLVGSKSSGIESGVASDCASYADCPPARYELVITAAARIDDCVPATVPENRLAVCWL